LDELKKRTDSLGALPLEVVKTLSQRWGFPYAVLRLIEDFAQEVTESEERISETTVRDSDQLENTEHGWDSPKDRTLPQLPWQSLTCHPWTRDYDEDAASEHWETQCLPSILCPGGRIGSDGHGTFKEEDRLCFEDANVLRPENFCYDDGLPPFCSDQDFTPNFDFFGPPHFFPTTSPSPPPLARVELSATRNSTSSSRALYTNRDSPSHGQERLLSWGTPRRDKVKVWPVQGYRRDRRSSSSALVGNQGQHDRRPATTTPPISPPPSPSLRFDPPRKYFRSKKKVKKQIQSPQQKSQRQQRQSQEGHRRRGSGRGHHHRRCSSLFRSPFASCICVSEEFL